MDRCVLVAVVDVLVVLVDVHELVDLAVLVFWIVEDLVELVFWNVHVVVVLEVPEHHLVSLVLLLMVVRSWSCRLWWNCCRS